MKLYLCYMKNNYIIIEHSVSLIKIVFFFFCIIFITEASAQNPRIDSLEKVLTKHPRVDKAKVDIMNDLAYALYTYDAEKVRSYGNQSLKLATDLNYQKGKANSLWVIGIAFSLGTDRKESINYYQKALRIAESINDQEIVCKCLTSIGSVLITLGDMQKSDEYLNKALAIALSIDNQYLAMKVLYNISRIQMRKGNYIEAYEQLQKVVRVAIEEDDKLVLSSIYSQLGLIHYRQGNEYKAMEYYLLALKMDERLNAKSGIFTRLINIAGIKSNQKEFKSALETIDRAFQIVREMNDSLKISVCLTNKGEVYQRMGKPEALRLFQEALMILGDNNIGQKVALLTNIGIAYKKQGMFELAQKNLEEASALAQKINIKYACCQAWMEIADLYFIQKQYSLAFDYVQKALNLADEINYLELQRDGYQKLSQYNVVAGDYKNAYRNYTQYKLLNDSLFNEKKIRGMALLESEYKFDKEKQKYELEQTNQKLKIKNQRQIIISLVTVSFLILILLFILYWSNKLKKKVLKLEIENINRELKYSQKEMASATLKLIQSSESDAYCVKMLENIKTNTTDEGEKDASSLINYYKSKSVYSNWEEFETLFIKVNGTFYDKLNERFPTLTPNERKLCVFLKLNMNNKDIAQITFQSEEALKKARLRLRKKLDLDRDINLSTFIQSL